jgi:hypothetical protein
MPEDPATDPQPTCLFLGIPSSAMFPHGGLLYTVYPYNLGFTESGHGCSPRVETHVGLSQVQDVTAESMDALRVRRWSTGVTGRKETIERERLSERHLAGSGNRESPKHWSGGRIQT